MRDEHAKNMQPAVSALKMTQVQGWDGDGCAHSSGVARVDGAGFIERVGQAGGGPTKCHYLNTQHIIFKGQVMIHRAIVAFFILASASSFSMAPSRLSSRFGLDLSRTQSSSLQMAA